MELMNKWFTRFLYGVKNGIEDGPKAYIVRERAPGAPRNPPKPYADYPNPDAKPVTVYPAANGALSTKSIPSQGTQELIDDVAIAAPDLAKASTSPNRLIFSGPELKTPLHLSGYPTIHIRLASSAPRANLSVYLVQLPWADGPIGNANLITRGWAAPTNYRSLTKGGDYHSMLPGTPLKPGEFVDLTFDLEPCDLIIPAGKRIGLMILSSDHDFTLWPKPGTKLTVDLDKTHIAIPVVGGIDALEKASKG